MKYANIKKVTNFSKTKQLPWPLYNKLLHRYISNADQFETFNV